MDRFVCRFGWILGLALCAVLVAIPLQVGAAEQGEKKDESELVKAANAAKKKKSVRKPKKPAGHPMLRATWIGPCPDEWKTYLDEAYWNVELHDDVMLR